MNRISKFLDHSVTEVTDRVFTTVSNIKLDFSRRSKRRKEMKKEKKLHKQQQIEDGDVEHKYKLVCDRVNCEYHIKPKAYEDFLDSLWSPKSNRTLSYSNKMMDDDKKSNLSFDKDALIDDDQFKEKLSYFDQNQLSSDESSHSSNDNLADILNAKDSVKLTITNIEGETITIVGLEGLNNTDLPIQPAACGKCMICFNKLRSPLEIMPCNHLFHKNCIAQWLDIKSTCPLCNNQINHEQIEKYKKRWSQ